MSETIPIPRRRTMLKIGLGIVVCIAVYMYYVTNLYQIRKKYKGLLEQLDTQKSKIQILEQAARNSRITRWKNSIHISVVACGNRVEEALVMLKSAALFTQTHLIFHIFTEPELKHTFQKQLYFWPPMYREKVEYELYNITFPKSDDVKPEVWKKLFRPCACQRLFIPLLLTDVDSLLYVDTDVLFLSPLEEIWKLFREFNSTQLAGLTKEHEVKNKGWYNEIAKHPYYGETGLNSGVLLMNLTRLRASRWLRSMNEYYKEYQPKIRLGDQDLINIYFRYNPEQLYVMSCEMNYRSEHCRDTSVCKPAEKNGAYILHGNGRLWFEKKEPAFKAVYVAFKEHNLENSIKQRLLPTLNTYLKKAETSNCGKLPQIFNRQIEQFINNTQISVEAT